MKKIVLLFGLIFLSNQKTFSQESFEGTIKFRVELESGIETEIEKRLKKNIGDSLQFAFSKTGNFKRTYFNRYRQKHNIQTYNAKKGMIYMINSHLQTIEDSLDVQNHLTELVSKQKKSNEVILGLECECVEYKGINNKTENITLNFCYSLDTPFIDYKLFEKHNSFFLNDFFETSQRPYLKYSFENKDYKFSYIATDIQKQVVSDLDIFRELIVINRKNKNSVLVNKKHGTLFQKGEEINLIDQNFKKQGIWKLYDDNRDLVTTFNTKDGKIISDVEIFRNYKLAILVHSYDSITIFENDKRIPVKIIKNNEREEVFITSDGKTIDSVKVKKINSMLEFSASYYGGYGALKAFINGNVDKEKIKNNKGTVITSLIVDLDGYVVDYEILSGDNPVLNEEALRILSIMPRWQPGLQRNRLVRTLYKLPINF